MNNDNLLRRIQAIEIANDELFGRILATEAFIVALTIGDCSDVLRGVNREFESAAFALTESFVALQQSEVFQKSFAKSVAAIRDHYTRTSR
ncbi:hypothetical protein [Glaciimonas sp. PAMC28666]|uniref:hypothetical protein n=1 Tax=Glaciimonas sp. PAMC28666 TaxID=2807626 RepID=UPI001964C2F8|nr:hypothetical protein [Glaciimonas sp. PAMC28666]QRX82227.1 hypothetical protein JQN73_19375 [Glaciimonas sp. PAMC28666]